MASSAQLLTKTFQAGAHSNNNRNAAVKPLDINTCATQNEPLVEEAGFEEAQIEEPQ
jgi:hypothetical protein